MRYRILLFLLSIASLSEAQTISISSDFTNNTVYLGLANPITAVAEDCDCNTIVLTTDNGSISGENCRYILKAGHAGTALIKMYRVKRKDSIALASQLFKVVTFPKSTFTVANITDDSLSLKLLQTSQPVIKKYEINAVICGVNWSSSQYKVMATRGDSLLFLLSNIGQSFAPDTKTAFGKLQPGDILLFFEIKTFLGFQLEPVQYYIKE